MGIKEGNKETLQIIQRLDDIYRNSPTSQALVANAPVIIREFKEMQLMAMRYKTEIQALAINRANDLKRFRDVAPDFLRQCDKLLENILGLQQTVRSLASQVSTNPDALTVINYTNKQIQQNISLFQGISLSLLNA